MKKGQKIYYKDELNEEFSEVKISPRKIDEKYKYIHKIQFGIFVHFSTTIFKHTNKNNTFKMQISHKIYRKRKTKKYKKQGYFVYVNHTQPFADTFIPSNPIYPKRNYFIVNPENVSMKILGNFVQMLGAIQYQVIKSNEKFFRSNRKTHKK